jgi:hypothetical protein
LLTNEITENSGLKRLSLTIDIVAAVCLCSVDGIPFNAVTLSNMNLKIMPVFENYFGDTMQQNCPW